MWLSIFGLVIHVIFLVSVFDVYFKSPIIHGMKPVTQDGEPFAKRLVLIVADGLRADYLFTLVNGSTSAPFLRTIMEAKGTWGISHTQVPSESRPGHVAIIGGIYEDPSAIAKGWKENPVEFDSVFNESHHTWSWGSPDILPMFAAGSVKGHIDTFMYSSNDEDFASKDASELDTWVFKEVDKFFQSSKNNKELMTQLNERRNIFFLHLLGLDTNGHSHKPYSIEYQHNIGVVDEGVTRMFHLFETFFKDNSTAYIFTSDHGMTDWGSHGSGDQSETETPIIAWGSGISYPQDPFNFQEKMLYDPRMEDWGLNHVRRHDIYQADIAPLMACVLGIPIPVNSMGTLPYEYLYPLDEYRSTAMFANAKQMLAHYQHRRSHREENTLSFLYRSNPHLSPDKEAHMMRLIRSYIEIGDYEQSIKMSNEIIALCIEGIKYYIYYDRPILSAFITFGYLGWIVLLISQVIMMFGSCLYERIPLYDKSKLVAQMYSNMDHTTVCHIASATVEGRRMKRRSNVIKAAIVLCGIVSLVLLIAQNAPWQYYCYFLTPITLWWLVYQRLEYLLYAWLIVRSFNMIWELAIRIVVLTFGIEILVFSFFLRPLLSFGLLFIGLWPFVMYSLQETREKSLKHCWLGCCILLASFTYLPVVGKHSSYPMVEVAGLVAFILLSIGLFWCEGEGWMIRNVPTVVYAQGGMILASVYVVHSTAHSIQLKEGLPLGNQLSAWIILSMSFIFPLMSSELMMGRLVSVTSALLCPFLLLSIRHEVFFYIALGMTMFLWFILEYYLTGMPVQLSSLKFASWETGPLSKVDRYLSWSDVRRVFFFLFFIILAFFGIGNVASVNSFDPAFVYCFITVFSPFTMGGLLLLKIIIPFLLVTCFFRAICSMLEVPAKALFLVFLVLSDVMALQFFFFVRTDGSWLDIGSSLSHYVICLTTTVFLMVLSQFADFLTTFSLSGILRGRHDPSEVLPRVKRGPHKD